MGRLRILHISDLHERAAFVGMPDSRAKTIAWDARHRGLLLGNEFNKVLTAIAQGGIDLVCFTGDLADWGMRGEYEKATQRLDKILRLVSVPRTRFFAVPGNHDVQRNVSVDAWLGMRSWLAETSDLSGIGRWVMGPKGPPFGTNPEWLPELLRRTEAFWSWLKDFRGDDLRSTSNETLGYRATIAGGTFDDIELPIHIVGLDSAWLCGAEVLHANIVLKDQGGIVVTKEQVDAHTRVGEHALDGYRIALVHHPLDHLADGAEIRRLLGDNAADILLHGHQHLPASTQIWEPGSTLRVLAAGCLVEGDLGKDWPNEFQVLEIDPETQAGSVTFRKWSSGGRFWAKGSDIYRAAPDGVLDIHNGHAPSDSATNPSDRVAPSQSIRGVLRKECSFRIDRSAPHRTLLAGMSDRCQFDGVDLHPHDGKDWCTFHLPLAAKAEWTEHQKVRFNERVIEIVCRAAESRSLLDLCGVVFPTSIQLNSNLDTLTLPNSLLMNCDFAGEVRLEKVVFDGWVYFNGSKFRDQANLAEITYKREAHFDFVDFGPNVHLGGSTFLNNAYFQCSKFPLNTWCSHIRFAGRAWFQEAAFGGIAYFERCEFGGEANFSTRLSEDRLFAFPPITFEESLFKDRVCFNNRRFASPTSFAKAIFHVAPEFHGCEFHQDTDLSETTFLDRGDAVPAEICGVLRQPVDAARAYRTLKRAMEVLRNPEDEARFRSLEQESLRAKQRNAPPPTGGENDVLG